MNETLQKIRQETLERLKAAKDESEIESLSVSVFGKSGSLTEILKSMGKLSKEERASVGQSVNAVKKELEKEYMKKQTELQRMEELIRHDRLNVKEEFSELLIKDLNSLLRDYFDYKGDPSLDITRTGDRFTVTISLCVNSLRSFSSLPE